MIGPKIVKGTEQTMGDTVKALMVIAVIVIIVPAAAVVVV